MASNKDDYPMKLTHGADLYQTMSTLRAVRRLRPDPLPNDVIERILQAACWAPTGGNVQPWRVIVVQDPERKAKLQAVYRPQWERYIAKRRDALAATQSGGADTRAEEADAKFARTIAAGDHLAEHLADAPAILMFIANPANMMATDSHLDRMSLVGGGSIYPAVQNAMLACVAEGVGCVLTTLHCLDEAAVMEALDIPEGWATAAMVPIGLPVGGGHGSINRQPPSAMAFQDSFGEPWIGTA